MSSLSDYPALAGVYHDLQRMDAVERRRLEDAEVRRREAGMPPSVDRVHVSWWPRVLWANSAQRAVISLLMEALGSKVPEVGEDVLLRAARKASKRTVGKATKLAQLFEGTPAREAWGELILPGRQPHSYQLLPPPEMVDDSPRTVPLED